MRALALSLLIAVAGSIFAGCGVSGTPYSPEQSCVAVGGIYRGNRCDMVLP